MPYPTDQLARKLDSLAERLERPRGWVVKEALEGYLALDEQRRRQTLAALTEVDGGATIDHAEVPWSPSIPAQPSARCVSIASSAFQPSRA
ncbi:MAG: ribbon-helix-helix protein, CopG family [Gammaproteobacteria bacterium]|nr:MAG: ribbon-helix-helix protein, CopG family [Gammaproteobacteria bacterium]